MGEKERDARGWIIV